MEPSDLESTVRFLVDELTVLRLDANTMAQELVNLQAAFVAIGKEVQAMRYRDGGVPKPSASKN